MNIKAARAFIRGYIERHPDIVDSQGWHLKGGPRKQFRDRLFVDGGSYPPEVWIPHMATYLHLLESKPDAQIHCPYRGPVLVRDWHKGCLGHFLDVVVDQVGPFMFALADLHLQGALKWAPDSHFLSVTEKMRSDGKVPTVEDLHKKVRSMLECNQQCWGLDGHFPNPPVLEREASEAAREAVIAYLAEHGT